MRVDSFDSFISGLAPHYFCCPADDTPTMMRLLKFEGKYDIRELIGTKYSDFGTTLLDCSAAAISALEKQYQHDALSINHEIFSRWLQGEGKQPVTWATLVGVLRDIGMNSLADDIKVGDSATPPGKVFKPQHIMYIQ